MSLDEIKPLIDWLQAHPSLAGFVIGLISLSESLAIIGTLIPGTLVMAAIGTLLGAGILPWFEIMAWAIGGAILGDGLSYWLGYFYHEQIRSIWPFNRFPGVLKVGERFFLRHGGKSVFLGRFIGPIRPIIPVVAGMMNMLPLRFTIANVASAIGWAPAYMLPGILIGALSVQIAPQTATRFIIILIVALLILWLGFELLHYFLRFVLRHANIHTNRLWRYIKEKPSLRLLHTVLHHPPKPHSHHSLSIALLGVTILALMLSLTAAVFLHYENLVDVNYSLLFIARSLRIATLDRVALVVSFMGTLPVLLAFLSVTLAWLLYKRCWQIALHCLGNALLAGGLCFGLKMLTQIPRPYGLSSPLTGWSYPSLSITLFVALLTYFAVIIDHQSHRHQRLLYSLVSVLIGIFALTQLYFSLHWFSDVIGSLLLGVLCTLITTLSYRQRHSKTLKSGTFICVTSLAFLMAWSVYTQQHFKTMLHHYTLTWPSYSIRLKQWWSQEDPLVNHLLTQSPTGKLSQLPNLQWAGQLRDIETQLISQGWEIVPKANLVTILNRIAAKNRERQLPLLPKLYLDRRPILTMTKWLNTTPERLVILRLWDAHIHFEKSPLSLWVGWVDYHQPWEPTLLQQQTHTPITIPAWQLLLPDLPPLRSKRIQLLIKCKIKTRNAVCKKEMLLIQP